MAKLMLFEKIKSVNTTLLAPIPPTTIQDVPTYLPRRYKLFHTQGWALRTRKPAKPIDKDVKEFIKSIFEEEKIYGEYA